MCFIRRFTTRRFLTKLYVATIDASRREMSSRTNMYLETQSI